jgi:hypothetical protein
MNMLPLQFLILTIAGWVNRKQLDVIKYLLERNHQGLGNELIEPSGESGLGRVACRERLSGLLRYYYRKAA